MADQLCRHCKRPISDHYITSACRISPTFFDAAPPEAKRCTCNPAALNAPDKTAKGEPEPEALLGEKYSSGEAPCIGDTIEIIIAPGTRHVITRIGNPEWYPLRFYSEAKRSDDGNGVFPKACKLIARANPVPEPEAGQELAVCPICDKAPTDHDPMADICYAQAKRLPKAEASDGNRYAQRRPWELEPYYSAHVAAMTAEKLHSKADIAAELAFRDARIAELTAELAELRGREAPESAYERGKRDARTKWPDDAEPRYQPPEPGKKR